MTVACVDVTFDTLVTLAEAEEASADLAWAAMSVWNCWPFCSSETRSASGVLEAKKATQSDVIAASAAEPPPDVPLDEDGAGLFIQLVPDPEPDEPLLPQPASRIPVTAAAAAGAREIPADQGLESHGRASPSSA